MTAWSQRRTAEQHRRALPAPACGPGYGHESAGGPKVAGSSPSSLDSEALIEHTAHLGDMMEAILATGSVSGELLGEPTAELRAKMAGSEVRLFTPFLSV